MDKNLIIVSKYTFIYMIVLLFAVLSVSIIAIQLFRAGVDDGSEIIIIAKPLTRSQIVWGKIIVFLAVTLVISGLAAFFCCFSIWYRYGGTVIGHSVTLGAFLGTFVIYSLFGSIAILLSLITKKLGALLINIGLFCVLLIYGMVATFTITTPSKTFNETKGVSLNSVSLVQKQKVMSPNGQTNYQLSYQWGATANVSPAVLANDESHNKDLTAGNYLSTMWNESMNNPTYQGVMYTNLLYQLVNLYTLNWQEQFNVPFDIYKTIIQMNASPFVTLKFKNVNFEEANNSFKKNLISFNYSYDNNEQNLATYYLTNHIRFIAMKLSDKQKFITDYGTSYAHGSIDYLNDRHVSLPWMNVTGFINREFSVNNTSANPYQEFIDVYFNSNVITTIKKWTKTIEKSMPGKHINPLSFYASLFAIADIDNFMSDETPIQLTDTDSLKKLFNILGTQISQFQYWTLLAILNSPYNQVLNGLINNEQLQQMMYCLLPNTIPGSKNSELFPQVDNVAAWVVAPSYAMATLKLLTSNQESNRQLAINNIKNNLYGLYPFFTLTNAKNLATFTIASGANFYNMTGLVVAWVLISFGFLLLAVAMYAKRDFS